jgi:hypothetical protein
MGEFRKHLKIAKEKLNAVATAYKKKQHTVVGDLATKVVEQLVEADAARVKEHFGTHRSRHEYSNKTFPTEINKAMRRIWFAYGDLGYDGVDGKKAKSVIINLNKIIKYFEKRSGEKIESKINV